MVDGTDAQFLAGAVGSKLGESKRNSIKDVKSQLLLAYQDQPPTASLMAEVDPVNQLDLSVSKNLKLNGTQIDKTSIGHDSITIKTSMNSTLNPLEVSSNTSNIISTISQICSRKISINQTSTSQISSKQISSSEIATDEMGVTKISSAQVSIAEIDATKESFRHINTVQVNSPQIGIMHDNPSKVVFHSPIETLPQLMSINNSSNGIISQAAVWHGARSENSAFIDSNISQIGTSEISSNHFSTSQVSTSQVGTSQINGSQVTSSKIGSSEVGTTEVSINERTKQPTPFQVSIGEVSINEVDIPECRLLQIGTTEINVNKTGSVNRSISQINTNKIPLPSSILSQQLLSIHTLTPEVQNAIKDNDEIKEGKDIPDGAPLTAAESADLASNELSTTSSIDWNWSSLKSNTVVPNTSIGHNGITENSLVDVIKANGVPQIGITEIGVPKEGVFKNSTSDIGITEVSTSKSALVHLNPTQVGTNQESIIEVGLTPYSPTQIGIGQVGASQVSSFHSGSLEISPTQIGISQVSTSQNSSFQNGSSQVNSTQVKSTKIQIIPSQINPTKISLPSSIPSQQLFSIHTLTPESITTINDTAQNLWNTGLAPQTPFDINLQLTDSLAKGQLAEAIVTKYDDHGRPIGGTIEVDPTANGTVAVHRPHYNQLLAHGKVEQKVDALIDAFEYGDAGLDLIIQALQNSELDGDKLTSATKIIGTVNDSNLDNWVLEVATFGSSNWSAIATGNQSTDGVLAQLAYNSRRTPPIKFTRTGKKKASDYEIVQEILTLIRTNSR